MILFFLGPPHVHPLGELRAVVGKEFSVVCPVSGYPIDKITWTKGQHLWLSHQYILFSSQKNIKNFCLHTLGSFKVETFSRAALFLHSSKYYYLEEVKS